MYYIAIHWDRSSVTGFIHPGNCSEEQAVKDVKHRLLNSIHLLKLKLERSTHPGEDDIFERHIERQKIILKSFKRPHRETRIKICKVEFPLSIGYWGEDIITQEYAVNILPFHGLSKEEHQKKVK